MLSGKANSLLKDKCIVRALLTKFRPFGKIVMNKHSSFFWPITDKTFCSACCDKISQSVCTQMFSRQLSNSKLSKNCLRIRTRHDASFKNLPGTNGPAYFLQRVSYVERNYILYHLHLSLISNQVSAFYEKHMQFALSQIYY